MFFTLDGIDGSGKSTQVVLLADALRSHDHDVVVFRDPGSTALSERIREILLSKSNMACSARAEMLLYMAARAQMVAECVVPTIAAGKVVVMDRYVLATLAYQGHAGGVPADEVRAVAAVATQGCQPDKTFLLDLDPSAAKCRRSRDPDRIERRGEDYLRRVRQGYLAEAQNDPRISVIDASRDIQDVHQSILEIALSTFRESGGKRGTR
jgi:dTMP kinase